MSPPGLPREPKFPFGQAELAATVVPGTIEDIDTYLAGRSAPVSTMLASSRGQWIKEFVDRSTQASTDLRRLRAELVADLTWLRGEIALAHERREAYERELRRYL